MASTDLVVGSGGAVLFVFAGIRRADATETSQTHDRRGNTRVYRGFSLISFRLSFRRSSPCFLHFVVVMVFICGVLLSRLVRYGHTSIYNRTRVIYCYSGVVFFLAGILVAYRDGFLLFTVGLSMLGPLFFCVVALSTLHENGPISLITKAKVLRWLGIRTYAIYLFHVPALGSVRALFELAEINPPGLTRPLAVALTLGCAALSWSFVEAPLIKLGQSIKYGRGAKAIVLTVEASRAI